MSSLNPAPVSDRAAQLEQWMEQYGTRIMHLAYLYLKDRQLAEDVTQDVFIKAYRAMGEFRGDSAVYTWLYRIAVNLCRDRLRTAYNRHTVLPGDLPVRGDDAAGPEEAAVRGSERRSLLAAIAALPDHYREVITLYYYQEMNTTEIARMTGEPEATVKTRLFRARKLLKDRLPGEGVVAP